MPNLPEELRDSDEAVAVWEAVQSASADSREVTVFGWRIRWQPRAVPRDGGGLLGKKDGDFYVEPRIDAISEKAGCCDTIRSFKGLRDALFRRMAAQKAMGDDGVGISLPARDDPFGSGRFHVGKRKRRCGQCAGCLATDCGRCVACRDKPKFGGSGIRKQACLRKQCTQPTRPLDGGAGLDADKSAPTDVSWLSRGATLKESRVSRVGPAFQAELPRPNCNTTQQREPKSLRGRYLGSR